jgi:NAD(P)-dependent dehydrogenase (short-subunit alcohol dehydrogenase family)
VSDSPPGKLAGRVVLITGAETGIGRQTALRAAGEGARVAAIGLDPSALDSLVQEVSAIGSPAAARAADVSDADAVTSAVEALADELGVFSVAHANAGVLFPSAPVLDLSLEEWDRVLAVNLTGVLLTFRAVLKHFVPQGGVLLATGSSLAIRPGLGLLAYSASKAGVHALVRTLALELAPRGTRVNVVAPGLTETPMTSNIPGYFERGLPAVPLGQLVSAAEVAALAVYLMSDEARSITGAVLNIDGGRSSA